MLSVNKQNRCDRIIFFGIIALLIFAPLAFGSVHVWAYTIMELAVFFLLLLWFIDRLLLSSNKTLEWVKTPVNLLLVIFLVFIGMQIAPLPSFLVDFVSPQLFADRMKALELLQQGTDSVIETPGWIPIVYYLHPVVIEWLKTAAYLGMFFLVLNTARSKRRIEILVTVLIVVGAFEAIYAIFQVFSNSPTVWWWKSRVGKSHWASGTFIVSNHFAGYMEMILCLGFGYVVALKKRNKLLMSGLGGLRAMIQKTISIFSPESTQPKRILFLFLSIISGVALLLSASRGGILSLGGSMLLMSILFFTKHRYRKYGAMAIGLCLIVFIYGLHIGIDPTLDKFKYSQQSLDKRLYTSRSMIPMILDYFGTGVGWGNFRYIYPRYVPADFDGVSGSGYSHNDWFEAGTEVGIAGGLLIVIAFLVYLIRMISIWRQRRDHFALGISAGIMAGLLSIGIHSFFDFNMHIPANPFTLAALLGLGYAALHRHRRGYTESFFYRMRQIPLTTVRRISVFSIILLSFSFTSFLAGRHLMAEANCPTEWNSTMNLKWNPYLTDIEKSIRYNSSNSEYHFKRAKYYMSARAEDETLRKYYNEIAIDNLETAVELNPAQGIYWYELGKRYSFRSYDPYGYLTKWLPLAGDCFAFAIYCAPKNSFMLFNVAWDWVWRSSIIPSSEKASNNSLKGNTITREDGIRMFQEFFQRSLSLNPHRWKRAVDRVWEYFPDDMIVLGIVPSENENLKSCVLKRIAMKSG